MTWKELKKEKFADDQELFVVAGGKIYKIDDIYQRSDFQQRRDPDSDECDIILMASSRGDDIPDYLKVVRYKVIWDTESDGEILDPRELCLPEFMYVNENEEDAANHLSDEYGWCVLSMIKC